MRLVSDWKFDDMIKRGLITHNVGDEVFVYKRKNNGYPRALKDGIPYVITKIEIDGHLLIRKRQGTGWSQTFKVHRKYMVSKDKLRDIKIDEILN